MIGTATTGRESRGIIARIFTVVILTLVMAAAGMTAASFDAVYGASKPEPSGGAAVVISGSTGEVLYDYHSTRKMSFAGTEKIMLAMVVLDNMESPDDLRKEVPVIKRAARRGNMFDTNEKVIMEDLLYAMLLTNSPEAAIALANSSFESTEACVNQMNARAQQMRLMDTRFRNVSGKYDSEQYTTAADSAAIMKAALSYGVITRIMSSHSYKLHKTEQHSERTIQSNNPLFSGTYMFGGSYTGLVAKTSDEASTATYIGTSYVDDMNVIVVLMREPPGQLGKDAKELYNYGYSNVTRNEIVKKGALQGKVKVRGGVKTRVNAYTARKGYVYIPPEGSEELVSTKVVLYSGIKAPLSKGDKVGDYEIYVAGERMGTVDIVVAEDVEQGWFPSYIYISNNAAIVLCAIIVLIVIIFIVMLISARKRKRERERRRREKVRREALRQKEIEDDRIRRNWTYSGNINDRGRS